MSIIDRWVYPIYNISKLLSPSFDNSNRIIIFDIDNTLVSSYGYPIGSVIALYHQALKYGYTIHLITARPEILRSFTYIQLRSIGVYGYTRLHMRNSIIQDTGLFKYNIRLKLNQQGYTIFMNIGDKASDFIGGVYLYGVTILH